MALSPVLGILLPGIGIPVLTTWMAGDIKFGKERRITEDSLRKIAIAAMAGIGVGAFTYMLTRPAEEVAVAVPAPVPKAMREVKMSSPVGVGGWYEEPLTEFYSGSPPYPEGHIYVD